MTKAGHRTACFTATYTGVADRPLPVTESAAARQLSLPCYPGMTTSFGREAVLEARQLRA
ncbi:hypothetical protein Pth03_76100 [Planotetraspora thailandica]|uniref:Uncharacterized protein n=1 Tax=Planotetraspora thailandica TaxID=487172 RepID=A0A8J4DF15_9ACTN|nr:hypothetical protein Pth03_76100 [Planotetraspora thailandica]